MIKIEEVRDLPFVGSWYRPPARSPLMRIPKADLIEYIAQPSKNRHGTKAALQRSIEYHTRRNQHDEIKLT